MLTLKSLSLCVLLLLCCIKLRAQQKTTTVGLFYEKAYLHTDRDVYTSGDDIWFKTYLLNAQNNKPIGYSNNLYVELINANLQVVVHQTIRLDDGLGNGDMHLKDTLTAGTYRLRAYTNWMRNFGDKFIFEKSIIIVSTGDAKPAIANVAKPVKRFKTKAGLNGIKDTLPTGPIVKFFPEGGYLINDVRSTVAFKAEDELGHAIAISGNVLASSGRAVAKLNCDDGGMGSFVLQPDDSQKYHAEVVIKGKSYSFKIANPLHKGFVLSLNTIPGTIVADISCNGFMLSEAGGTNLVITGQHGGKICYKQRVNINSKNALVQIPDTNFPEGIACVTLQNEYGKPIGERLVYVHHNDNSSLKITTDKTTYGSKEKVTVKLKLNDTTKAHLSLSVVDASVVPVKPGDMVSYLNLRSEVNGVIDHPEKYFDTTNVNRFKQLDLLLLTQGWRSYLWQRIADTIPNIKYDVEQGITLTGHVRKLFNKKGMPNLSITMFAPKAEGQKLFSAVTDSAGNFTMDGAKFYGYQYFNFTSRDPYKMKDGDSKGHSGGWIQVDSLNGDKTPVYPVATQRWDTTAIKTDLLVANYNAKKAFDFKGNNQLKTVQVKAYTNRLEPIVQNVGLAEQRDYGSLAQYLLYMIPQAWEGVSGCHMDSNKIHKTLFTGYKYPYLHKVAVTGVYVDKSFIDYYRYCDEDFLNLSMTRILKISIGRRQTVDGMVYVVLTVLKPGVLEVANAFDNTVADVTGYYKARQFYTPRYDTPSDKPDYRTTIHWEPNITTDANGEATVSFYNADAKSKIQLVVQGVTDKGIAVAAMAGYEIK